MAGGVEKMSLDLARGLSEKGYEVVILSLDKEPNTPFFEWPASVIWIKIGIGDPNVRASFISRIQRLKAIRKVASEVRPSIGIGFQVGSFALLRMATLGLGIRTIAAERNSPNLFNYIRGGKTKRIFSNLILFSASRVAVQFESYSLKYPSWLRSKMVVTPNWVERVALDTFLRNTDTFQILFIGRLTFQKNVMVLINAMSNLPENFQLTIIGDGPAHCPRVIPITYTRYMTTQKWLITGGAGYIGAHVADEFLSNGKDVVIYDSLYRGFESRIEYLRKKHDKEIPLIIADIRDIDKFEEALATHKPYGIIHTAALKAVGESMEKPDEYFEVNHHATTKMLNLMTRHEIKNFIFSSTAAVYGAPDHSNPIKEDAPKNPISPYGASKLAA